MSHIDQAIYDTVHSSDISAKEIAASIGMSHQVLLNKANPQSESHKLTLLESVAIQRLTGNHRISEAVALELSTSNEKAPSKSVLESVLNVGKELGDVMQVVQESLADGRYTDKEKEATQQEISEAIAELEKLRVAVKDAPGKVLKAVS